MNHLVVTDLACVRGDRRLFSGVGFRLEAGGLLQVAGANGAGKTSLLRLLCGLSPPADGRIEWNGEAIAASQTFRASLCYQGHLNALQEALTVEENLRFLAALAGHEAASPDIAAALAELGLRGLSWRPVRQLSQGQKRRAALARLMLTPATLWVLDEPFVALDTAAVATLASLVSSHLARGGLAIYTSHQKVEIAAANEQVLELAA